MTRETGCQILRRWIVLLAVGKGPGETRRIPSMDEFGKLKGIWHKNIDSIREIKQS